MALSGNAFLAMWHDVDPPMQDEYREWHTREHMPERLAVPGFRVGKRLVNPDVGRYQYATVYAGDTIDVFHAPAYLERLNDPTPWSQRIHPAMRHFLRVACERIAWCGGGDGGAIATIRLTLAPDADKADLQHTAQALADKLLQVDAACACHIGLAQPAVSSVKTRETDLRPDMNEPGFDAVVLVEGTDRPALQAAVSQFESLIASSGCGLIKPATIVYHLAYQLRATDLADTRSNA